MGVGRFVFFVFLDSLRCFQGLRFGVDWVSVSVSVLFHAASVGRE